MNISDVQRHLHNLVTLLDDGGAKVAKELASFGAGMDAFADMPLKKFLELLETMAVFKRDGQLPTSSRQGSGKRSPAGPKKQKPDPEALAAETKAFYDRVTDPSITGLDIDSFVDRLSELTGEGLRPVAAIVGVVVGKSINKKKTLADIKRHILERKGATQRRAHLHVPTPEDGNSHFNDEQMETAFSGP